MTTSDKHPPMTVEQALDELDRALMDMPEQVLQEELARYGLDYDEVAEEGLGFTEALLQKDRQARRKAKARTFLARHSAKMTDLTSAALQRAQQMFDQGHPLPAGAFAGRQEVQITDEERLELLRDLAMTQLLEEMDDGEP